MSTLYCLGEIWLQLSPACGTLAESAQFSAQVGGAAAAFCTACARRGLPVSLLAQLGEDAFGHRLKAALDASGVDTRFLRFAAGQHTPVLFADDADRLAYPGAGRNFPPEALNTGFLADAAALHFTTEGLLDGPLRYTHLKAILAAREAGVPVSFAPHLTPALWADEAFLRQTFFQFLPLADLVFLTETELEFLFGSPEFRTALFALFTGHVQFVGCVGPRETWLLTRNDVQRLKASLSLETVCAGVLHQLMSSKFPRSGSSWRNPKAMDISSFVDSISPE